MLTAKFSQVFPPSERRKTSRPVSASSAKTIPPAAPNTNPPSVESSPLIALLGPGPDSATYSHFRVPVAASTATALRVGGSSWLEPLPTRYPFAARVALSAGRFVKIALHSVAGMKIDCRFGSKAGFASSFRRQYRGLCFVLPPIPGRHSIGVAPRPARLKAACGRSPATPPSPTSPGCGADRRLCP
jgi:hypothetical protein